jgi:hypothetical protein
MEKNSPHCKLPIVKAMIKSGQVRSTRGAREGAAALGFDFRPFGVSFDLFLELASAQIKTHLCTQSYSTTTPALSAGNQANFSTS